MTIADVNEWAGLLVIISSGFAAVWVLSRHATKIETQINMLGIELRRLSVAIDKLDGKLTEHDRRIQTLEETTCQ